MISFIEKHFLGCSAMGACMEVFYSPKCFKFLLFKKCDITRLLFCHFSQYEPFKAMIVIENGSAQYSKHWDTPLVDDTIISIS